MICLVVTIILYLHGKNFVDVVEVRVYKSVLREGLQDVLGLGEVGGRVVQEDERAPVRREGEYRLNNLLMVRGMVVQERRFTRCEAGRGVCEWNAEMVCDQSSEFIVHFDLRLGI